jgi:ATP-dependent Clp protease ATP-binding subunit ClpB
LKRLVLKSASQDPPPSHNSPDPKLLKILQIAQKQQKDQGDSHLAVDHVLYALLKQDDEVLRALQDSGVQKGDIERVMKEMRGNRKVDSKNAEA